MGKPQVRFDKGTGFVRTPPTLRASEQDGAIDGRRYRLVVYRSSALDRRRLQTLDREISQSRTAMERAAQELGRQRFACAADAESALRHWQAAWKDSWCATTAATHSEITQRRPGRPRKDPGPADMREDWRVIVTVGAVDATRRQRELERRGTFVLITTVPESRLSAANLLREYKSQTSVERHFHFVNDPLFHPTLVAILQALGMSDTVFTTPPHRLPSTVDLPEEIE